MGERKIIILGKRKIKVKIERTPKREVNWKGKRKKRVLIKTKAALKRSRGANRKGQIITEVSWEIEENSGGKEKATGIVKEDIEGKKKIAPKEWNWIAERERKTPGTRKRKQREIKNPTNQRAIVGKRQKISKISEGGRGN